MCPEVKHNSPENFSPFSVYEKVVNLDNLVELFLSKTNIYARQSGCNFCTSEEIKAFPGVVFIIAINEIPSISGYWDWNYTNGNAEIQN